MLELLAIPLIVLLLSLSPSRRAALKRSLIVIALVGLYLSAWRFTPFSPERWAQSSLFERRLLAKNFLKTHAFQTMTKAEIETQFGKPHLNNWWTYYLEFPELEPSLSGVLLIFQEGKVSEVHKPSNLIIPRSGRFDNAKWKAASRSDRAILVADLIESKVLVGKSQAELIELLGPPDQWQVLWYDLGMLAGEIDGYTLDFEINERDKVVRAEIYSH